MPKNNYVVKAYTTFVAIKLEEFPKFKDVFKVGHVYNFYVYDKVVDSGSVIFKVRSMRTNEFLDLLDDNQISWEIKEVN